MRISSTRAPITLKRSSGDGAPEALRRLLARVGVDLRVDGYALALALVSLLALIPLLHPGYFWGAHDARHSVYFLFEFDRVFADGVWYPRWFPDMTYGYGYPLFNIYGPLAFYLGEFFHLLGFDFVASVKLVFSFAWVLSGLAMYGFVKRILEHRAAAFIAGLLYVFMPYHLIDVYVRAALAESVALVFLPLTLWAFYETIHTRTLASILFAAFAYAGMVFAHNGIALLFSLVLGAWMIFLFIRANPNSYPRFFGRRGFWNWLRELARNGLPAVAGLALGLGLTGIFMAPLVLEYRYINVAQWTANYYNYQDHFVELYQLFSPLWGFGISNRGPVDGLAFQIGLAPIVLFFFALVVLARNPNHKRAYTLFFMTLSLVVVLLMFEFSLPAWQVFGLASVAQFPWRLLTLTLVSFSIVGGSVMLLADEGQRTKDEGRTTKEERRKTNDERQRTDNQQSTITNQQSPISNLSAFLPVIVLAAVIIWGSLPYITAQNILEPREGPVGLAGLMAFEHSANEMTGTTVFASEQPRWSPLADNYMANKNVRSKIDFSSVPDWVFIRIPRDEFHTTGERVDYNAPNDDVPLVFNVQMYPGWRAFLTPSRSNEIVRELPIEIEPPYGRIKVTIPQGEHGLLLRFQDTPPRTTGALVSGVSLLIALVLLGVSMSRWTRRRRQQA